jgi:hypothetical protein
VAPSASSQVSVAEEEKDQLSIFMSRLFYFALKAKRVSDAALPPLMNRQKRSTQQQKGRGLALFLVASQSAFSSIDCIGRRIGQ